MYEVHRYWRRYGIPDRVVFATEKSFDRAPHLIQAVVLSAIFTGPAVTNDYGWPHNEKRDSAFGDSPFRLPLRLRVLGRLVAGSGIGVKAFRNCVDAVSRAVGARQINETLNSPSFRHSKQRIRELHVGKFQLFKIEVVDAPGAVDDFVDVTRRSPGIHFFKRVK